MSRKIDLSKKLSEEDREYLLARGREQQVLKNDVRFQNDPDPETLAKAYFVPGSSVDQAPGVPPTPGLGGPNTEAARTAELAAEDDEDDEDDEEDDDEEVESVEGDNYDTWSKKQLESELEDRDLPTSGNKKALVARLREDDDSDDE